VIVDPDFLDHWRTGMVVDALQDHCAPIYILRLWAHCQERKADTFVMPARGLKAQCKFPGDADRFETALIEAGFLKRDGDTLTVVGWAKKNSSLFAAWDNGLKGGRPRKEPRQNPEETHGQPSDNPELTQTEPTANPSETQTKPIREEKRREEKTPSERRRASALPCPADTDPQVWEDWMQLRKGHSAKVSETAVSEARKEAAKAGMTLEDFLRVWCIRGSRGLQASWLKPDERGHGPPTKQAALEARNAAVVRQLAEMPDASH
jgi:hypothetical protein